jgi:hypothetical protein
VEVVRSRLKGKKVLRKRVFSRPFVALDIDGDFEERDEQAAWVGEVEREG